MGPPLPAEAGQQVVTVQESAAYGAAPVGTLQQGSVVVGGSASVGPVVYQQGTMVGGSIASAGPAAYYEPTTMVAAPVTTQVVAGGGSITALPTTYGAAP